MEKTLRIGFAMGGGVSLGTFNGAALTQTLKLAILRGHYRAVEVDCFSGASAGAMSLAVMLRGLVHQKPGELADARTALTSEFGEEFLSLTEGSDTQRDLLAAQVVQARQEQVWVRDINIDVLLKDGGGPGQELRYSAGLVNRAAVEKIAREAISFEGASLDLSGKRLLADRVLFGCALTNLTPILVDARAEHAQSTAHHPSLADGMTSWCHREMRVFDLMFGEVSLASLEDDRKHPSRWYRYWNGEKEEDKTSDLRTRKAWSTIAATAVASGAFPGAFEPVVLTRHSFEFGYQDAAQPGLWPAALAGCATHPFTYSDGGAFNNEPIRDCFRMASFLDADANKDEIERWIVFVDPNVEEPVSVLQLPLHRTWRLEDPNILGTFDGWRLQRLASLDRLVPFAGSLVSAILNEARSIEGDKIFKTHKRFLLRDGIRLVLLQALTQQPDPEALEALCDFITSQLESNRCNMLIPVGGLTLEAELRRVISEEAELSPLDSILGAFLSDPASSALAGLWLRALAFVAVDLVMDMTGKSRATRLIAIAPAPGEPLPGGLLAGFGGFMSEHPGEFEVRIARYRAQQVLEDMDGLALRRGPPQPKPVFDRQADYEKDFRSKIPLLARHLTRVLDDSHLPLLSLLPDWAMRLWIRWKLDGFVDKAFASTGERTLEVALHLRLAPDLPSLELDGKGVRDMDIKPVRVEGTPCLISIATLHYEVNAQGGLAQGHWQGVHLNAAGAALEVYRDGLLRDERFCQIELPSLALMRQALQQPNPRFSLTLQRAHEGTTLQASVWDAGLSPGVVALEETLYV